MPGSRGLAFPPGAARVLLLSCVLLLSFAIVPTEGYDMKVVKDFGELEDIVSKVDVGGSVYVVILSAETFKWTGEVLVKEGQNIEFRGRQKLSEKRPVRHPRAPPRGPPRGDRAAGALVCGSFSQLLELRTQSVWGVAHWHSRALAPPKLKT